MGRPHVWPGGGSRASERAVINDGSSLKLHRLHSAVCLLKGEVWCVQHETREFKYFVSRDSFEFTRDERFSSGHHQQHLTLDSLHVSRERKTS